MPTHPIPLPSPPTAPDANVARRGASPGVVLGAPLFGPDGPAAADWRGWTEVAGRPLSVEILLPLASLTRTSCWPAGRVALSPKRRRGVCVDLPMRWTFPSGPDDNDAFHAAMAAWVAGPALVGHSVRAGDDEISALFWRQGEGRLLPFGTGRGANGRGGAVVRALSAAALLAGVEGRLAALEISDNSHFATLRAVAEDGTLFEPADRRSVWDGGSPFATLTSAIAQHARICGHTFEPDGDGVLSHRPARPILPPFEGTVRQAAAVVAETLATIEGSTRDGTALERAARAVAGVLSGDDPPPVEWRALSSPPRGRPTTECAISGTDLIARVGEDADNAAVVAEIDAPCLPADGGPLVWGRRVCAVARFSADHLRRAVPAAKPRGGSRAKTFSYSWSTPPQRLALTAEDAAAWAAATFLVTGRSAADGAPSGWRVLTDILTLLHAEGGGPSTVDMTWSPREWGKEGWTGAVDGEPYIRTALGPRRDSSTEHAVEGLVKALHAADPLATPFGEWHDGLPMPTQAKVRVAGEEASAHELLEIRMRLPDALALYPQAQTFYAQLRAAHPSALPDLPPSSPKRRTSRGV